MSCNTTEDVRARIIMKYSTISGATPSIPLSDNHEDGTWIPTDLYIGEFFTNAADDTFWIRTDNGISQLFGGTGGTGSFIGDFVHISGGTFSGLVFAPTFSANYLVGGTVSGDTITADYFIGGTYSGDGSLLTGIVATWLGGTVSDGVYFTNEAKFTNDTWLDGNIYSTSGINISGSVSISGGILTSDYFVGDGSGLTNLPTGTFSDIYTTGATLSGDTIIFTRNDSNTYDIDLTPILNQQSITTMTWDSSTDELLTTFNDASTIGITIDSFAQVSSTGPITAPEFYGGIFYGEFVGTFSGLTGGGGTSSQTLSDTLILGNTTGANDIIITNNQNIKTSDDTVRILFNPEALNINVDNALYINEANARPVDFQRTIVDINNSTYTQFIQDYGGYNINSSNGATASGITMDTTSLDIGVLNNYYTNYTNRVADIKDSTITDLITGDYTQNTQRANALNTSIISITNDRDIYLNVVSNAINTNVNETSTGFYSSTGQRNHLIESYVQDADYLFSENKNAYKYKTKVDNQTLDVNSTFTQVEDNVEMSITDNAWSTFIKNELSTLSNGSKQQKLQISPNPSIFVTDDKRGGWMQTSDDTTALMIYCDMDPATTDTSIVQIKAHVRGISSDKMLGYAAEITSWVRVNPAEVYPVTQIGVVDYIIKSEFTTAHSSFVISGPNMYIDVTGEIGITIDWTCNVEILYDKNTF